MNVAAYHEGERAVQQRAKTEGPAESMARALRPEIPPVARDFLAHQRMIVLGASGAGGRIWATALTGHPGFARATGVSTVTIDAVPADGDPVRDALMTETPVGMIAVDFVKRRRMRLNGLARLTGSALTVALDQVYANCPKYIQRREPHVATATARSAPVRTAALTGPQQTLIETADTFFIATADQAGHADASHRGGNPGFVHAPSSRRLIWPDYAGNGMFNTLGNLHTNPAAGLLFLDWTTGRHLQVTGRATVNWDEPRVDAYPGAQRLVEFEVDEVLDTAAGNPLRWSDPEYSPSNPD